MKQNNFVSPNETTVLESGNVSFFFFAFLIDVTVMLTEEEEGNVLSCLQ